MSGYENFPIDEELLKRAAQELERGGLVAFPTETVYGLGADAANAQAIRELYALKGRPADHPHWHSRTLDIDIIECNGVVCDTPRLTLPHPRWRTRDFVRIPLQEIAPEWLAVQ